MIQTENEGASRNLSLVLINLMKGIIYRETDPFVWQNLIELQNSVRDYVSVLGLELMLDESEGYAWLRTAPVADEEKSLPKLVVKRQLSYPQSLLIALLRKKLAEFDAGAGETRLVLSVNEVVEMVRVFLGSGSNEAKFHDKVNGWLNKIAELGFVRRLKNDDQQVEVCRIIKAYVDAQWLNDFDNRLQEYIVINEPDQNEEDN